MRGRKSTSQTKTGSRLDSEPNVNLLRETAEAARRALEPYGEPRLSLQELRDAVDKQLQGHTLSEWLLRERESTP